MPFTTQFFGKWLDMLIAGFKPGAIPSAIPAPAVDKIYPFSGIISPLKPILHEKETIRNK